MHNQRHTYQSDQPLTAWVHAIARYKMIDLLRAKSAREALHDPLDDDLAVFAESGTEAGDARRDLAGLLETLPDRQRLPIVHVKLQGLSVAETAAADRHVGVGRQGRHPPRAQGAGRGASGQRIMKTDDLVALLASRRAAGGARRRRRGALALACSACRWPRSRCS